MTSYQIALELPPKIKQDLALMCHGLPFMEWTEQDNFHITLRHFGPLSEPLISEIKEHLATVHFVPFQITLLGIDYKKGSLYSSVVPSEPVIKLRHEIDRNLSALKLPHEEKSFKPHVTLGKSEQINENKIADFLAYYYAYKSELIEIKGFTFFNSIKTAKKTIFSPVDRFPK